MNSIYEWLDSACKSLRYRPDREAAYKELKDNYEDHRLYLVDQGAYPGVAERQALAAMGDPAETRRMLSAAYHPLLTTLWRVSRILLIVVAVMIVFAGVRSYMRSIGDDWNIFKDPNAVILWTMEQRWAEDPDTTVKEGACFEAAQLGEYEFTVIRALSVKQSSPEHSGQTENSVVLILKAKGPFELKAPEDIVYWLAALDDEGGWYNNIRANADHIPEDEKYAATEYRYSSLDSHYFLVIIANTDPDVKWVDLNYAHRQGRFTMRVVFDKEAAI